MSLATHALALAEAADHRTASHARSVAELASAVAEELGLAAEAREELELSALMHDIGKVAIPADVLEKPAALTLAERALMETHTTEGETMLRRADGSLADIGQIVRSCHERWDGGGYPDGLAGHEIPLAARIIFCCDTYDAMTVDRPYARARSHAHAVAELWAGAGTQFDPTVVAAVARVLNARRPPRDVRGAAPAAAPSAPTAPLASARATS
jgi:putative nucleotidyltransferase with HDIG domain